MQRELPAPTASGVLSKTPFPHLLVYALERRLTGSFELAEGANVEATLLVLNGCPAKIRTAAPIHHLGTIMAELGMISPEAVQSSLAKAQESSRLQGEVLLEMGATDQAQLDAALRSQVERKVEHVFGLSPEATFAYYDDLDLLQTYGGAPTPIDPFPVLWRGVRERPAREHVETTVQRVGNALLRASATAQLERFAFAARELTAIELLRQRPVGTADIGTEIGPELAPILVYFLMIMRQVDLIDPKAIAPPPPAPAPPQAAPPAVPKPPPAPPPQPQPPQVQAQVPAPTAPAAGSNARPATSGQSLARVQLQRQATARAPLVVEEQVATSTTYDRRASSPGMPSPVGAFSSTRTPGAFAPVAAATGTATATTARSSAADAAPAPAPQTAATQADAAQATNAQADAAQADAHVQTAQADAAQASSEAITATQADAAQAAVVQAGTTPTSTAAQSSVAQATTGPSTVTHPSATAEALSPQAAPAQAKAQSALATKQAGPRAKPPPVPPRVGAATPPVPSVETQDDVGVNIDSMIAQTIGSASTAQPALSDPSKPLDESLSTNVAPTGEPEQAPVDAAAPPASPGSQPLSAEHDALRAKIFERAEQISSQDYFQMLGLDRNASPDAIRKAYIALAKVWHPDRLPPALADVRDACSKVFAYLNEAHATLSDADKRQEYVDAGASTIDQKKSFQGILEAATEFQKAEFLLKRNPSDPQAYEIVKRCVSLDAERVEYMATLAWLDAQKPDAQTRDKTLEKVAVLDRCIDKNPNCERAYFYRGMLYKRVDEPSKALKDFKKSAELNPRNLDALREVRLHNMRGGTSKPSPSGKRNSKPPQGDKVGGLFGRLFKK